MSFQLQAPPQVHHRSASSQHSRSRSMSQYLTNTSDVEEMSDQELVKQVTDLRKQVKVLALENEILEKTIMRVEPSLLSGVQQALEYASKLQGASNTNGSFAKSNTSKIFFDMFSPSKLLTSPSRASTRKVESSARMGGTIILGAGPKINIHEKSELVATEMENIAKNLEKSRNKAAKQHALLKAQLEVMDVRMVDVEKATESFNKQVIIDGWDKIAQRVPAEIWIRYMSEWVKICDKEISKLRLRTSTLNALYTKLTGQIKVKAELSESLRPVDFEKIKIENQELVQMIDKKMRQLVELKAMTGDANLNLAIHKQLMMDQNAYLTKVKKDIETKTRLTLALDKERDKTDTQVEALQDKLEEVRKVRLAYEIPDIMDYVQIKAEMADLKHVVKMLENRVHIQQIALKSLDLKMKKEQESNLSDIDLFSI